MLTNVSSIISILNKNRDFFDAMFDKRHSSISVLEAESYLKNSDILEELESKGLVEIYHDEARLCDSMVAFYESILIEGYEQELYDYAELFKKIEEYISTYYRRKKSEQSVDKQVRDIFVTLRKIPNNLMATFEQIRRHVEFTYKEVIGPTDKKEELVKFKNSLERLSNTLSSIQRQVKLHNGFFEEVNDSQIRLERIRLNETIKNIRNSLGKLISDVISYIAKAEESAKFYSHIQDLVELIDNRDFLNFTNVTDIISTDKAALCKMNAIPIKHKNMKLHPEYAYEEEFSSRYKNLSNELDIKPLTKAKPTELDATFLNKSIESSIDYDAILNEYLSDNTEKTLLEYIFEFEVDANLELLVDSYLNLIIANEAYLFFTNSYREIDNRLCIEVKKLSQRIYHDN